MLNSKIKKLSLAAALLLCANFATQAHTTVFGTVNAGVPGSVVFWMGGYHQHAGAEGSLSIGGSTVAFSSAVSTSNDVPDPELVFGSNLFWAATSTLNGGTAASTGIFDSTTPVTSSSNNNQLLRWQSVLISGLTAGAQDYTISGMNGVNWADYNTGSSNWTGSIYIPSSSVSVSVSAPPALALFGLGLVGLGLMRRKTRK
jgi:hypothetical protein